MLKKMLHEISKQDLSLFPQVHASHEERTTALNSEMRDQIDNPK